MTKRKKAQRKAGVKKEKRLTSKQLDKALDRAASYYIRLKDSYQVDGIPKAKCVTCGVEKNAINGKDCIQNGHFMSRRWFAIRWEVKNMNPQCSGCNVFRDGEQFLHGVYIDKKYGKGTAAALEAQKRYPKPGYPERVEILDFFIQQLKELNYEFNRQTCRIRQIV